MVASAPPLEPEMTMTQIFETARDSVSWLGNVGSHVIRVTAMLHFAVAASVAAQSAPVQTDLPLDGFIDRQTPIRITVSEMPTDGASVAVLVANQDVTALLTRDGPTLTYRPNEFSLPTGENHLTVYLVDAGGGWSELASFPIRVRGALGFEGRRFTPGIDLGLKSQPAEGHDPVDLGPDRATYGQVDGELRLGVEQTHSGGSGGVDVRLVGTSYQNEALRFFQDGEDAPKLDLSSYSARIETEPLALTLGTLRFGEQRHLANGLAARGARVDLRRGRLDGSFVSSSATQIVGWDNLLGFGESDNRLVSANLGLDALATPGGLRVEASWMNGRVRPSNGFNQGALSDFEKSDGVSFRVRSDVFQGRVRVDAGYAKSQFTNPEDELLSQGQDLVEVRETRRNARYLDADVELLKGVSLWGAEKARLSVGYRHERVDPLYRTVGTYVRSDVLDNRFDIRADISWLTISGSFGRGEDNLDNIPSILTTRTDRTGFTAALPLQRETTWLPSLNYRLDRTHQEGLGIPVGGGFDESHVPDQLNVNHTASANWQLSRVRLGLQLNVSDQDNRQPGRENADFLTRRSAIQLGVTPTGALDLGLDLALERRDDQGATEVASTRRWGASVSWRVLRTSSLSLTYSDTFQDNDVATLERGDRAFSAGWNSFVPFVERLGGQYFLRFNYQTSRNQDFLREFDSDQMFWTLQFGLSLSAGRQ